MQSVNPEVIVAFLALIVSILIYVSTSSRESHARLVDNFNKLYNNTFSLRNKISQISELKYNNEFFYELERIEHDEVICNLVLDYLNEMEDFFFLVVGHRSVRRLFEKLMSLALYQRLSCLYGFIIRKRIITNNDTLFLNYERVLKEISNMKKIKSQSQDHRPFVYVGIRSSDQMYAKGYFKSDISIYTEDSVSNDFFDIRPNQNQQNIHVFPYQMARVNACIEDDPNSRFIFYNGLVAYNFPESFHKRFLYLNPHELIQSLNNKADTKRWLSLHQIPVIPYETMYGQEITVDTLKKFYANSEKCVVQSNFGGGGIGTFLVSAKDFPTLKSRLQPLKQYLVSSYIDSGVSVNTHVFISDKQTVLSPGSVQIIDLDQSQLCYRGADFIAFRYLPEECRERVRELSIKIANCLRERGYRGVAGLDFLISEEHSVFCMEINPRFQASSLILDLYLSTHQSDKLLAHSVFELNEQAFINQLRTTLCFDDEIDYSCYFYYKGDQPIKSYIEKMKQFEANGVLIHEDGLSRYAKEEKLDCNSYLFRAVFPHAICNISPDMTLWVNDNIPVRSAPQSLLDLKIALLNQGVRLADSFQNMKTGVYNSIDISFSGMPYTRESVNMNCAYQVNLSQYSPYELEPTASGTFSLKYYGAQLGMAQIEEDQFLSFSDTDRRILYLATDRLRIKLIAGCEYKNIGRGCRFCNLPVSDKRFSREEITTALKNAKKNGLQFRHILIGGGTCLSPDIWDDVIYLCQWLKNDDYYKDKELSLMSVLPPKQKLVMFRDAGLDEVAFNIEMADDNTALQLMPGKRENTKEAYYNILEAAVHLFGVGKVRSALVVGLDKEDVVIDEVRRLAEKGIIPCLSAMRALPNTFYANTIHPDNATLRRIYDKCAEQLKNLDGEIRELGPQCKACRNNMLSI